ncbi:MAG TPA: tetratricopeptide repeat protein [Thermoanaerobaculia bacterium]|jgi:tetratricopeptide (TPR) repeat protein
MRQYVIAFFLLAAPLAAQEPLRPAAPQETPQERLRKAIALHDAGDYAGAIRIYRELLAADPANEHLRYELAFSLTASGEYAAAIEVASEGAKKRGDLQAMFLEMIGNAYDGLHKPKEAIAAYKRGIAVNPSYSRIHFNLGVAYIGQDQMREARAEFERTIALEPTYPSPHYTLAEVYRTEGYRVPAILAYSRFLELAEPRDPRTQTATRNLHTLLNLGVEQKDKANINITVDPNSKKDLGDFSALEMMLALASGARFVEENEKRSDFDREAAAYASFLAMLSESAADYKQGFVAQTYVPAIDALVKAGHADAFAHVALAPLLLPGTKAWVDSHNKELIAFDEWLQSNGSK